MLKTLVNSSLTSSKTVVTGASHIKNIARNHVNSSFPSTSPRGAYIWRGDLTEGFLRYEFGRLIFGVAYTRRGLFSEFYGILNE